MGMPDGEDIILLADADLDVCVFVDPTAFPDSFFCVGWDISGPRCFDFLNALAIGLIVKEVEDSAVEVSVSSLGLTAPGH
jgi:hypothetical protein